jgi:hypothetical protein
MCDRRLAVLLGRVELVADNVQKASV